MNKHYTIQAQPTIYKGFEYKSKLEAQFASFFTQLGLCFDYEPELFDFGKGFYYLPDFRLYFPDNSTRWIEAKGPDLYNEAKEKCYCLAKHSQLITQIWCGSWGQQTIYSFVPNRGRVWVISHKTLDKTWYKFFSARELNQAGQRAFLLK